MVARRRTTLIAVMSLAIVVTGCGSDDDGSESDPTVVDSGGDSTSDDASSDDDSVATGQGALPDGFPEELTPPDDAVYDELVDSLSSSEQGGKKVFFVKAHIPGTVSEVTNAIRSQLGSADFEIIRDEDTGVEGSLDSYGLDAENDTYVVYILVDDLDTETSVEGSANVTYEVREK